MRIAICDDNAIDRELAADLLADYFAEKSVGYELRGFESGVNLIYEIQDGAFFDVIFLDIYMNELLGIEVARKLRELHYEGNIIFLTATADFALEGYDVKAAGYLLKPHSYEKVCKVMDRILKNTDTETYQIRRRAAVRQIPYNEIMYVESSNSKCMLHRSNGEDYVIYKRLDEIEQELQDRRFLRCHQSYLVNMNYISRAGDQFELINGEMVLIRQKDRKQIRQLYMDYMEEREKYRHR